MSNVFDNEEGRSWLRGLLVEGEATVTFTKVDGSERVMRCTLSESVLPKVEKTSVARHKTDEALSVWDLDSNGWRSFRWDSIKEVSFG